MLILLIGLLVLFFVFMHMMYYPGMFTLKEQKKEYKVKPQISNLNISV